MEMYIPPEELAAHAGAFAAQIRITGRIGGRREAVMADRSLGVLVRRSGDRRADSAGEGPSGAMRWLRDNLYLARQAAYEAREAFRSAGRLRAAEGRSLIREVCAELLLSGDGDTDEERPFRRSSSWTGGSWGCSGRRCSQPCWKSWPSSIRTARRRNCAAARCGTLCGVSPRWI